MQRELEFGVALPPGSGPARADEIVRRERYDDRPQGHGAVWPSRQEARQFAGDPRLEACVEGGACGDGSHRAHFSDLAMENSIISSEPVEIE